MSKFFRALEQAERERVLREQARQQETDATEIAPRIPTASQETPFHSGVQVAVQSPSSPVVFDRQLSDGMRRPERHASFEPSREPRNGVEEHLVSLLAPTSFEAEQYRALRHTVEELHKTAALSILGVSSPTPADGKTTTAINLAGALAQTPEARVLVVDADLRGPSLAEHLALGGSGDRGLVDAILDSGFALEDLVRHCPSFNLWVLPAGRRPGVPYEVLKSPRLGERLREARLLYNYVILDMPPLLAIPDCRVMEQCVDGFLVVVAAHKTPRKLVQEALSVMDPAKVVGFVFNCDDRPLSGYYYHTYGQPVDGDRAGWWGWARKRVVGSFCRWRSSRPRRGR